MMKTRSEPDAIQTASRVVSETIKRHEQPRPPIWKRRGKLSRLAWGTWTHA